MEEAITRFMDHDHMEAQEHSGFKDLSAQFALALASANCQGKSSNDTQRRVGRRVYPVHDLGRAEVIYTIRTSLVQACPGKGTN